MNPQTDSVTPETRANFNDDGTTTITFDDFDETFIETKQQYCCKVCNVLVGLFDSKFQSGDVCLNLSILYGLASE